MEDWQKELREFLESVTNTVEEFFQEVSEVIEEATEEINREITADFEQFWQDFFSPILEIDVEVETQIIISEDLSQELDFFINPKVEPNRETHPACIGCHHYHGRLYNGNLLVCGMHPYGWDNLHCPDWEGSEDKNIP
jgi:hypothetical protein